MDYHWPNLARKSLEDYFSGKLDEPGEGEESQEGVFVTLQKYRQLRGCIGCIQGQGKMPAMVYQYARSAALKDPRFPSLERKELKEISIEVTILTPFEKMAGPLDFEMGTHGVYLTKGFHSAVFLPQVGPEQAWDKKTLLEHLSIKAGLHGQAWQQSEVEFQRFSGEIFSEL
ncbi:MAG: AmmeMemoRadiSam system protein A [Spirochaetaceae bacterium]|jgi:AmmeMemoRadiSam system protein A|nr:AmmeMemoRadiSam system protein A [Spirochaetaceae bacterium]